jgi:hypothetical protein
MFPFGKVFFSGATKWDILRHFDMAAEQYLLSERPNAGISGSSLRASAAIDHPNVEVYKRILSRSIWVRVTAAEFGTVTC